MVFRGKISPRVTSLAYYLRQEKGYSYREIAEKCKISKERAIYYGNLPPWNNKQKVLNNAGRKKKLSTRDERCLLRAIKSLRLEGDVNFTVKKLVNSAGLDFKRASYRTYVRFLNRNGYSFRQTRKKGLLSRKDRQERLKFARKCKSNLQTNPRFFQEEILFYLDGVSFVHKTNPHGEALRPKARVWRTAKEGLQITAKGSKDLAGGRRLHCMVLVSFDKGVVLTEYYEKMSAKYFADFVRRNFTRCLRISAEGKTCSGKRHFIMDNDPSQRSKPAKESLKSKRANLFIIPPRSPDLNPIETIFNNVKRALDNDAISNNIRRESFDQFKSRVKRILMSTDIELINKTIDSMPKRIDAVLGNDGHRTKY